jgi:hypothetical protein
MRPLDAVFGHVTLRSAVGVVRWPAPVSNGNAERFASDPTAPSSVKVQVVVDVVHPIKCPLAMTAVGPRIVLLAVVLADDPIVKVKAFPALAKDQVPVLVDATPSVGVSVHEEAVVLVALGTVPAAALVALVPPTEIGTAEVRADAKLAPLGVARKVATPVPKPLRLLTPT